MKEWGFGLIASGILIAAVALLLLPSTVATEEMINLTSLGSQIGSGRFTDTYNLPRAQLREMIFHGGGFVFLAGILLLVGGTLEDRLRDITGTSLAGATPAPSAAEGTAPNPTESVSYARDEAAANAEAAKNKVMMAYLFGGFCVLGLLLFVMMSVS